MIMYYSFNFMNDVFDDYCNTSVDFNTITAKCDSYEYVLSNFTQSSNLLSDQIIIDEFVYNNYLNNCFNVLIVFFVTSTSLLFSILIVSICVYEKMINQFVEKYNANREYYEYDTYFFEYLDEFNELHSRELNHEYLDSLEYKYIKQKTPKGDVLMNYNNSISSFEGHFLDLESLSSISPLVLFTNSMALVIPNLDIKVNNKGITDVFNSIIFLFNFSCTK